MAVPLYQPRRPGVPRFPNAMSRVEQIKELDRLCDEFERKLESGAETSIEAFLSRETLVDRDLLLRELVRIEIDCRIDCGQTATSEEFLERFPDDCELIERVFGGGNRETVASLSPEPSTITGIHPPKKIGEFEIQEEIARGGMGIVYRARQPKLNRDVALKMILAGGGIDSQRTRRFLDEARVVATLQHPQIVQIYDLGEFQNQPFISFEYIRGGSLASKLNGEPGDVRWAVELIRDVASGVEHAHQAGIVHRDLKPSNILLTEEGSPKIADFGLAKQLDSQIDATKTGDVLGTPNYMSPEQATGRRDIGPSTDVYSLGAVLYELLAGRPPFQGETQWSTVNAVINSAPPPLREYVPNIPQALDDIAARCLAKVPEHRYASAKALADDLDRWLNDEPVVARRRRSKFGGSRAVLLAVVCVGVFVSAAVMFRGRERDKSNDVLPEQFTNSIGMKFVLLPSGEFDMGAAVFVAGDPSGQVPVHRVQLKRQFYLGEHEVTVQNFRQFVKSANYPMKPGVGFDNETGLPDRNGSADWENPGWHQTDNHPVVNVSWEDATAFCDWLSEKEGRNYRLPTEAEWEYACRAGTRTVYSTGDDSASLQSHANLADNSFRRLMETFNEEGYYDYTQPWNDGFPFTAPVGQFKANPFGLYDMHGNAQEWCSDWFDVDYYSRSPSVDPQGPSKGETRVKRGGDWLDYVNTSRSSFRRSEVKLDVRTYMVGFRVLLECNR